MAVCGTQPAHSKNDVFSEIKIPNTWVHLNIIVELLGLYSQFFNYKMRTSNPGYILCQSNPNQEKYIKSSRYDLCINYGRHRKKIY